MQWGETLPWVETLLRGLKPTATIMRRSATRVIVCDAFRGLKPHGYRHASRRDEDAFPGRAPVASHGMACGFMRRAATRFIVWDAFRGLKPFSVG
jgi:hypothetical protein